MSNAMTIYHLTDDTQSCENIVVTFEEEVIASIFQSYSNPDINEDLVDKIQTIIEHAQNTEFVRIKYMTFDEYERLYEDD